MKKDCNVVLLGSNGYLGRTLTVRLQRDVAVFPTHRQGALFPSSLQYDFWTDDLTPLLSLCQADIVVIAMNVAYVAQDPVVDSRLFRLRVGKLVHACRERRVIYISSDGIFDGRSGMYTETDVPHPITPYGKNLQFFEERVREFCDDYCIIRPSYLFGYAHAELDRRLARVRAGLLAGEHFTFFKDMIKSPLDVNQAAEAIAQITLSNYIGVVHVGGVAMSVYDFYHTAMQTLQVPCEGLSASMMPADSTMPKNTSLDIRLMKGLTGVRPYTVQEALQRIPVE
ncbi:dTDP-4-dehydrorhamnose reductase [Thermosporothrix hazakensis]|jgi:dTDP-4-dehydrorhamnose reductase|uniref:dTDP-4-dehydrorhamnose reductase n=2 Tax=Thermosporothrix TaxID=768650 RepID=A0A326U4F2_THEHA|nr:sugar nucleotide-binding protein [Thermosporothrix hazakensis]PZW26651.1 dTDP-4-dehydrorhamnose reductase [Thermosporothrix hazakensis]BBH89463.1 dTDP-4-dehydrorhamnose reductase [Thermosporothrix sp. COM3]GCE47647.1 dTDP-4-dehydrorhamnose reductase [Thermosporothrix hazakensis]